MGVRCPGGRAIHWFLGAVWEFTSNFSEPNLTRTLDRVLAFADNLVNGRPLCARASCPPKPTFISFFVIQVVSLGRTDGPSLGIESALVVDSVFTWEGCSGFRMNLSGQKACPPNQFSDVRRTPLSATCPCGRFAFRSATTTSRTSIAWPHWRHGRYLIGRRNHSTRFSISLFSFI